MWRDRLRRFGAGTQAARRALDGWLASQGVRARIVAEFQDNALLKAFGQAGHGVYVAPSAIEREVRRQFGGTVLGRTEQVRERFYAICAERRFKHPAVIAISAAAHSEVFRARSP